MPNAPISYETLVRLQVANNKFKELCLDVEELVGERDGWINEQLGLVKDDGRMKIDDHSEAFFEEFMRCVEKREAEARPDAR